MKNSLHCILIAGLTFSGAAFAQDLSKTDKMFVQKAAMGGMAEVAAGKIAADKGTNDQVKQFGQMMVDDHGKANDQLKQIATTKGLTIPDADPKADSETKTLSKLSSTSFDKGYIKLQAKDHMATIKLFQKEAASGKDADLKKFASDTLPTLQAHMDKVNQLKSSVGM